MLQERKKQLDLDIDDIHQYLKEAELDDATCRKICQMLKDRVARHSHIKKELIRVDCFLSSRASDHATGMVNRQIQDLEKRYASPRLLSELYER